MADRACRSGSQSTEAYAHTGRSRHTSRQLQSLKSRTAARWRRRSARCCCWDCWHALPEPTLASHVRRCPARHCPCMLHRCKGILAPLINSTTICNPQTGTLRRSPPRGHSRAVRLDTTGGLHGVRRAHVPPAEEQPSAVVQWSGGAGRWWLTGDRLPAPLAPPRWGALRRQCQACDDYAWPCASSTYAWATRGPTPPRLPRGILRSTFVKGRT